MPSSKLAGSNKRDGVASARAESKTCWTGGANRNVVNVSDVCKSFNCFCPMCSQTAFTTHKLCLSERALGAGAVTLGGSRSYNCKFKRNARKVGFKLL